MLNKYFILSADCKLVDGPTRSIIYDLTRASYNFIPNILHDILTEDYTLSIGAVIQKYGEENKAYIIEYFEFLLGKEYIYLTPNSEEHLRFPKISTDWTSPYKITNAIIDYKDKAHPIKSIIEQFEDLGSVHLEVRFFSEECLSEIAKLAEAVAGSRIQSISLLMPNSKQINLEDLLNENRRIKQVTIYNAPKSSKDYINTIEIIQTTQCFTSEKCCGVINKINFTINTNFFNESTHFNTCLNRKIAVDADGNIKNCPSMKKSFGKIEETSFEEVLKEDAFKKNWNIRKSQIDTCKVCEFRNMCLDCRAYLKDPSDIYSKPLKCTYDPYSGEWKERVVKKQKAQS